jgi:hypothetical protein
MAVEGGTLNWLVKGIFRFAGNWHVAPSSYW